MECTVYGRAETRAQGLAFAQAIGVATVTQDETVTGGGYWQWTEMDVLPGEDEPELVTKQGPEPPPGATDAQWVEPYEYTIPGGRIVPLVSAHITTSDDGWAVTDSEGNPKPGWFFNVRYYGDTAAALANGGDPNGATVFERFPGLIGIAQLRTGEPMVWASFGGEAPQGFECAAYGVRLYDPQAIATPANVIA